MTHGIVVTISDPARLAPPGPWLHLKWRYSVGMVLPRKRCSKCGQTALWRDFTNSANRRDGKSPWCRQCCAQGQRDYYQRHRQEAIARSAAWTVANRERSNANKRESARRHPRPYDEKERAWTQDWSDRNPDKTRAYALKWARANPESLRFNQARRRARKRGAVGSHTRVEWDELCLRYGNCCLACGVSDVRLTEDHVVPLVLGGSDHISNIQPLCARCNKRKGTKTVDYRAKQGII
jgi:5-methylcytosine-specific restriction endonuclease McrA